MIGEGFDGFPKDMFSFLNELKRNNNRDWFNENKLRYQAAVQTPVSDFIVALADALEEVSPHFIADPRPHRGSMFRIYRDTRFSKDKRPYKEHVGCHFRHAFGKDAHAPGFYLHLAPDQCQLGAGIWKPSLSDLEKIRRTLIEKEDAWNAVLADSAICGRFGILQGESLKNWPRGFDANGPLPEDVKRKSFFVKQTLDDDLVCSPDIVDAVAEAYRDAASLMRFLTSALSLPY